MWMAWAFNVDVNIVHRSIIMLGEHNHVGLHPFMAILVNRKHHILLHLQSDNLIMTPPHILEFQGHCNNLKRIPNEGR